MTGFVEILLLLLVATVKFIVAAGIVLANDSNFLTSFLILLCGGSIGTIVFFYLGAWIDKLILKLFFKKRKTKPKKMTWMNRFIVKINSSYGLIGLSVLTPVFFSIPLGCFLAAKFYSKNKSTLPTLLIAVFLWSLLFSSAKFFWH